MNDPLRTVAEMAEYNKEVFGPASRVTPKTPKKEPFIPSKKAIEDTEVRSHCRRIVEWQKARADGDAHWPHPSYTRVFFMKGN
jgi:hypothetical protein